MEELRKPATTICVSETVYDGQAEQGVELDYVLPDYYPEIFRILSCRLTPRIMSYSIVGENKLMLDGNVDIRLLYLTDGSNAIHCVEQRYTYTKTVDIGKGTALDENVCIKLNSRTDYCNCRAVSSRRIDVRGAVSTRIRITADRATVLPVISDDLQVKSADISCYGNIRSAEKQFSVREEIETGASGINSIIRTCANAKINEVRIIADKAVVKGVVTLNAAYGINTEEEQGFTSVERMTADIPVSQIVELDGVDESYTHAAEIDILNCELTCNSDNGIVGCNILAVCRVRCCKETTVSIPVDVYSTQYETEHTVKNIRTVRASEDINKQFTLRTSASCEGAEIEGVWDCTAEVYNTGCTFCDGGIKVNGSLSYQVLCRNNEGVPCWIEKQEAFEHIIAAEVTDKSIKDFSVICIDADHAIKQDGTLDLTAIVEFNCHIVEEESVSYAENVKTYEDKPKYQDSNYALRIFYADGTEDCWDIAKRYGTSVEAVLSENEIENRDVKLSGMVLIPSI